MRRVARPEAAPWSPPVEEPAPAPLAAGADQCRDLAWALRQEWLITNGVGGYASATILGVNTRRVHGLLVAATHPPVGRAVLLAKLEETLVTPTARYEFSTNQYAGVVHPEGYRYQERFRLDPWPTFVYQMGGLLLEKSVRLVPGEQTVIVQYHLRQAAGPIELLLRPLVACRDFRWVSQENPTFRTRVEQGPGTVLLHPYEGLPPLILHHGAELFEPTACWYKSFEYAADPAAAGDPSAREDLYSPGQFLYLVRPGETAQLIASTDRIPSTQWGGLVARATEHHRMILESAQALTPACPAGRPGPLTTRLIHAAEPFLVKDSDGARGVMAGYHGRVPSGREALVALPGLTLATGRPDVARELFQTLAGHCRDGLLPVRFTEEDGAPEYDSVDTSLWLFWAVDQYLRATGDLRFIGRGLLDVLMDIVDYYVQGTQFYIAMDQDGLITTQGEELPLTWMPGRAGKPVEVNALWYNALMTMSDLGERFRLRLKRQYARLARLVKANFLERFWNPQRGCLYDVVGRTVDDAVRPNQLLAAALPYPLVTKLQARAMLEVVSRELLTPVGVRTLSPSHPSYAPGSPTQGSAWPWLLGPYWSAYRVAYGTTPATRELVKQAVLGFQQRLADGGWGTLPERYHGDPPHAPAGAIASAWSIAELLRLLASYNLIDI